MNDKSNEMDLVEMNAEIAKSRKEIAALAASLGKLAGGGNGKSSVEHEQSAFRHGLQEVGTRGGEVANGFADEIKRHPLISGVTALGIGFVIAMLLFKRG